MTKIEDECAKKTKTKTVDYRLINKPSRQWTKTILRFKLVKKIRENFVDNGADRILVTSKEKNFKATFSLLLGTFDIKTRFDYQNICTQMNTYRVFVLWLQDFSIFPKRRLYFWSTSQVIFLHVIAFKQTCFRRWDQSDFLHRWICLKSVILKFGIFCRILQYFLIFKTQVPLRLASLWLNKAW